MAGRGRGDWRWVAAALLIAALVLGLGFALRASGLGAAANVAQLVSLAPLVVGLANWPRARRVAKHGLETGSLAMLGEHLRAIAYGQALTGRDVRDRLPGWDGETVDAFLNGTRRPGWDFVTAFLDSVAGDDPWRREAMEQCLRLIWIAADTDEPRNATGGKNSISSAEEPAGIKLEQPTTRRIALWGPPASGKTTFVAALNSALSKASPPWALTGSNVASTASLIHLTLGLAHREFPRATDASLQHYSFILWGTLRSRTKWRIYPRIRQVLMRIPLSIVDVPGGAYRYDSLSRGLTRQLIEDLRECDGIVFFFDPASEAKRGDAYDHFYAVAAFLEQEMGSRLPQYVAVCIAKFDHPGVFPVALESGHLVADRSDPHGFPRIPDNRAAAFFDELYLKFHTEGVSLRETVERYFYPDRIRYFVISSTGFYLNDSGEFDPDDYYNLVTGKPDTVRGGVRPVNLLEPLFWLAAPDNYDAAARLWHGKYMPFAPRTGRQSRAGKEAAAVASNSPWVNAREASHLVCLVEGGTGEEVIRNRLDRLSQLTSVAVEANKDLRLSLVTYGTHRVARGFCEEPSTVLFWAADSATMLKYLDDASQHGPRDLMSRRTHEAEYRSAAQIECALAEVTRRLNETTENVTVVTLGVHPPFPSRMGTDSQILPCPARNDWKAILAEFQGRGVVLGAIHDHAYKYDRHGLPADETDEIWARLGAHANATLGEVDIHRFAGAVGLLSPDKIKPYPPDWRPTGTHTWEYEDQVQRGIRLDRILRDMPDEHDDDPQGGYERRYGDDDL